MQRHALQLDLPERRAGGVWPWVVLAVAASGAALGVERTLEAVPSAIARDARAVIAGAGETGVEVRVNGRDVELSGTLRPDADRDRLVGRVAAVDGARIVLDGLSVFDPEAREREARAAFGDALGRIDTGAFAFEPNSTSLAPGSEGALDALVRLLDAHPETRIRVIGHTDNTGRPEVNLGLSRRRAAAVVERLVAGGVAPDRLIALGYGATQPIADNATEAGRARNRRIEIRNVD